MKKIGNLTLDGKTYAIMLGTATVAGITAALVLQQNDENAGESAPIDYRAKVVKAAASQVGLSDKSVYCKLACRSPDHYNWPKDWCAVFALWTFIVAGLNVVWRWGDPNCWFSYRLSTTTNPKPGDVAYFTLNQHHAIVESVNGNEVHLINGNGVGGKVTRSTSTKGAVTVFYSIEGLLP
jgi:hypothetical protein